MGLKAKEMNEIAAIFEVLQKDFYSKLEDGGKKDSFDVLFSPFSTGFTRDDFAFLNPKVSSEEAKEFYDELYEFAQIANTIPRSDNYWSIAESDDYLDKRFSRTIRDLRLMDDEDLNIDALRNHKLFDKALDEVKGGRRESYRKAMERYFDLKEKVDNLKSEIDIEAAIDSRGIINEEATELLLEDWKTNGDKDEVENEIIQIVKHWFQRFLEDFQQTKSYIESSRLSNPNRRGSASFLAVYCRPDNLYDDTKVKWSKAKLNQAQIKEILENAKAEKYSSILGESLKNTANITSIMFEYIFVDIERSWLSENILKSPFWDMAFLDKDVEVIPRVTTKLIFARNIKIDSTEIFDQDENGAKKNLGPFVIDKSIFLKGQPIKLSSYNVGYQLPKSTILATSKSTSKKTANLELRHKHIAKKQKQFQKVHPRLNKAVVKKNLQLKPRQLRINPQKLIIQSKITSPSQLATKPISNPEKIKLVVQLINLDTEKAPNSSSAAVLSIKPKKGNARKKQNLKSSGNGSWSTEVFKGQEYMLNVGLEGFNSKEDTVKVEKTYKDQDYIKTVLLEPNQIDEILLLGVVAKKIAPYPNPIIGVNYI